MSGDWLDIALVLAVVAFAISGYRQGFVVGVLAFVGFLGGAVLGAKIAPSLASAFVTGDAARAVVAIVIVFLVASIGQLLATAAGAVVRRRLTWRSVRLGDSVGGAVVSAISVLLVAWLVGTALANGPYRELSKQVRHSWVLQQVDEVMPGSVRDFFAAFRRLVADNAFPQVFGGLGPESIVPVEPPDPAVLQSTAVRRSRGDIVKIVGITRACTRRTIEGSGFLYARNRVMTNAHVVAGVGPLRVITVDNQEFDGRVVLYNPRRDVAVLDVPGLNRRPLSFAGPAQRGANAVVAGYPNNGPFTPVAARVRSVEEARGPDIYQRGTVEREIYSVRAVVRPGNSGGPLLAANGQVYGVVFAAATDDSDTGYALTAAEVSPDADAGRTATETVSTQSCD